MKLTHIYVKLKSQEKQQFTEYPKRESFKYEYFIINKKSTKVNVCASVRKRGEFSDTNQHRSEAACILTKSIDFSQT